MSSHTTSHQSKVISILTKLREHTSEMSSKPDAASRAPLDFIAKLRSEEERGSKPTSRWLSDPKAGHMRLAVAQAKLFHDTLEVTPTAFDAVAALESHSSADDTEQFELTMAFYEAFKWLLDEPHFDVIYDHNGDKAHEFARRAAYNFASYIISDLRYEHFEIARKLPPARLLIDQASWIPHPARRREFAFSTRMEAVVKSYREHSISQKELADDLGVYVSTISRYSPRRGRNSTMRTDAPRAANGFTSRGSASRPGPNLSISTLRKNLKAAEDLLFPPSPGVDSQTLDARVRSLEQRIAALEAKLDNGA